MTIYMDSNNNMKLVSTLPINAQKPTSIINNDKPHYSQTPTVESLDRFWLNDTSARSTAPQARPPTTSPLTLMVSAFGDSL